MYSGRMVNVVHPESSTIRLEDIAHGLAHTIRYRGALGVPLTVAQHCVMLSHWADLPKNHRSWALFHDAAEAYLGDVPAPVANLPAMSGFYHIEQRLLETMALKYRLDGVRCPESVLLADKAMLQYEVEHFNNNPVWAELSLKDPEVWTKRWGTRPEVNPFKDSPYQKDRPRLPWTAEMAKYLWLLRVKQLGIVEID